MIDRLDWTGLESLIARTTTSAGQMVTRSRWTRSLPTEPAKAVINQATLEGLAQSIKAHGVRQPMWFDAGERIRANRG